MKNDYNLKWSLQAYNDLKSIFEFINVNWSEKAVRCFIKKLDNRIILIRPYLLLFLKSLKKKMFFNQANHNFNSESDKTINIISVFDVRLNPKN